ncbi:hypothetical protein Pint_30535 [Pistacia integerrima]|uniref:Uncharacterized protein n=1 Tax=Pistacia integerrima TaxID=434235 RepID=A0ACC0X1S3_9ROSI|nr:hypothetical protein Pint_30535 [Pistacia integerrima]
MGWQLSGSTFLGPFTLTAMGGVFWNVAIHWINDGHKSLYLNVEEEKVGEMPMPPFPDGFPHRNYSRWFIKYQVDLCGVATAFPETLHNRIIVGDNNLSHYRKRLHDMDQKKA